MDESPKILATDEYPSGTIIADGFKVLSPLAKGGMARVYVGEQISVKRIVALKVLSHEFSHNQGVVERFRREGILLCQLGHPNTVKVYDMAQTFDGRLFIAMELLKGESLGKRIDVVGALQPEQAIPIVIQVAQSLIEAHALGVIHRDLKPDNIYLSTYPADFVKVLDFGIAKIRDEDNNKADKLTRQGTAPGTPEYMSPEQARGQELDGRSDLYSLGVVLYEMLSGAPPFSESTFLATILMHVQATPPPLPESLPLDLRNYVVNRLMAKDRNCRPDSAEVFVSEITELAKKVRIKGFFSEEAGLKQAELNRARAEIEALRSQLAQTKEMMRSTDMPIVEANAPSSFVYSQMAGAPILPNSTPHGFQRPPSSAAQQNAYRAEMNPSHQRLEPVQQPSHVAQRPDILPPQARQVAPSRRQTTIAPPPQSSVEFNQRQSIANVPNPTDSPALQRPSSSSPYPQPQPVSYPALKPTGVATNRLKPQTYPDFEDEEITVPAPRNAQDVKPRDAGRDLGSEMLMSNRRSTVQSAVRPQREVKQSNESLDDGNWYGSKSQVQRERESESFNTPDSLARPVDPLVGRVSVKRSTSHAQVTFMSFAQPVIGLMGPNYTEDALNIAMGIWNASITGADPLESLGEITKDRPELVKFIRGVLTRKEKFFSQYRWQISDLKVKFDSDGKLDLQFKQME